MPLREDLLNPIPGDNPSGESLRYDPIYDEIKEARREEDDLEQGAWKHERKVADYLAVINTSQDAIATRSKDLQLAVWLTEALLKEEGFPGFLEGLNLCRNLLENFWETVYPEIEDGDEELRAMPLEWLNLRLEQPLRMCPVVAAGYHWFSYQECRNVVGYEESAQTKDAKKQRTKLIAEGKVAPEDFDQSFGETPKAFYLEAEKSLDAALESTKALGLLCEEKFTDEPPSFGKLEGALSEVRHLVHSLLEKKRETEPDPVEDTPAEVPGGEGDEGEAPEGQAATGTGSAGRGLMIAAATAESPARRSAVDAVVQAAASLRALDPKSPAPYLMLRGLRWGELRAAIETDRLDLLEGPPTELRQQIKMLALKSRWGDLITAAEEVMSLPCSRGWIDLQRFVIEACAALGSDYDLIAKAIRSELRSLLRDVPDIVGTMLLDDTPAANPETRAWLRELLAEPEQAVAAGPPLESEDEGGESPPAPAMEDPNVVGWKRSFVDPRQQARAAFEAGDQLEALEILQREVDRQRSGRGRFLKKLQMAEECITHGNESIAQPILGDLLTAIDDHKLESWEDRELAASALLLIIKSHAGLKDDAKEKKKYFTRICRLDPAKALEC
jgi:type VI secretion system protein ImpA